MEALFLGLDLGGTNVKAGVVTRSGRMVAQVSVPTGVGPDTVIANMVAAGQAATAQAGLTLEQIAAVGIGSPGPLSTTQGVVFRSANLPGFVNVPLRARIGAALGRPTVLENDANAAGFGEYWAGAGKGGKIQDLVMLTLGTGVGGGVIVGGHVVHGKDDFAAEIGHMILFPDGDLCGCGQRGCLEVYTAASRVGQRASYRLHHSAEPSTLRAVLAKNGEVTAADVAQHAQAGDALALGVWDVTCKYLALACVSVAHILDPEMIVLAGGMSKAGAFLIDTVNRYFAQQYWKLTPPGAVIALAELGNDAGAIGAAGVAMDALDRGAIPAIGS